MHEYTSCFTALSFLDRSINVRKIPAALSRGRVTDVPIEIPHSTAVRGLGPRAALRRAALEELTVLDRRVWMEEARITCLLGNSAATRKSFRSGVSCYFAFVGRALEHSRRPCLMYPFHTCRCLHAGAQTVSPSNRGLVGSMVQYVSVCGHVG